MLVNCSLFYWHLERETRHLRRSFSQRARRYVDFSHLYDACERYYQRQHDGFIEILESTDAIRDRHILSRQADPPCPSAVPQVPGSKTSRMARATVYKSKPDHE